MSRIFSIKLGALDLTNYPFMILFDSLDQGSPENAVDVLASFLQDGDIEVSSRSGNRTISIKVALEGTDLLSVAAAEAALVAEVDKQQNELTITPGDGISPPSVFQTFRGSLTHDRSEASEDANLRVFVLTMRAFPWPRSSTEVVVSATGSGIDPPAPTITTVDDCTSATNWARGGFATSGPTVVTGAIQVAYTATIGPGSTRTQTATRTGLSTSMAGSPYLRIQASQLTSGMIAASGLTFQVNGVVTPVAVISGAYYYLDCTGLTINSVAVFGSWTNAPVPGSGTATLRVDDISRSDQLPGIGTTRQLLRTIAISGSTRTQATLALEHTTSSLGDAVAYVYDNTVSPSYSPPLRQYRAGGGTVSVDTSTVSGGTETLATSPYFDIPIAALPPGVDELDIRVKATSSNATYVLNATAQTRINGANVGQAQTMSTSEPLTTTAYTIVAVGLSTLRQVAVNGNSTAVVRITVSSPSGAAVTFDEGWVFNLEIGTVAAVACGTGSPAAGGSSNRLWVYPASLATNGLPTMRRGFASDGSDAFFPDKIAAWMPPQFTPPSVGLFTVTTGALNVAASARYWPRWHTNAAA